MQRGQSNVVPKLNLKKDTFASKSAPNSARSNQADPSNRDHQLEKDEKYLAWRRRKEYRPTSGGRWDKEDIIVWTFHQDDGPNFRSKAPLKMTKSLTIGSKMRENSITLTNVSLQLVTLSFSITIHYIRLLRLPSATRWQRRKIWSEILYERKQRMSWQFWMNLWLIHPSTFLTRSAHRQ